jgi:hypothetical protein
MEMKYINLESFCLPFSPPSQKQNYQKDTLSNYKNDLLLCRMTRHAK